MNRLLGLFYVIWASGAPIVRKRTKVLSPAFDQSFRNRRTHDLLTGRTHHGRRPRGAKRGK